MAKTRLGVVAAAAVCVVLSGCASEQRVRVASGDSPTKFMETPVTYERGSVERVGPNEFQAQCSGFGAIEASEAKQRTDVWCWAACAEMIHRYKGRDISQEEIAARIHGGISPGMTDEEKKAAARAGSYDEIIRALVSSSDLPPQAVREASTALDALLTERDVGVDEEGYLGSHIQRRTINSDIMVDDLLEGEPVVVGLRFPPRPDGEPAAVNGVKGHAYVAYGATFRRNTSNMVEKAVAGLSQIGRGVAARTTGEDRDLNRWLNRVPRKYDLIEVQLMNPWTGTPEPMPAAAFAERVDFMISGREARQILEDEQLLEVEDE